MKTSRQLNLSAPVIDRGDKTLHNTVHRRLFAFGLPGILFTVGALLPSPAQAQCKHWDVSGQWSIHERDGSQMQVNMQQDGGNLTGLGRVKSKSFPDIAADITGNITDNAFTMKVVIGEFTKRYVGSISPDGKLSGTCHLSIGTKETTDVGWNTFKKMKCADANESSSNDTDDRHEKKKKNKKKHHHHDDDENQGND